MTNPQTPPASPNQPNPAKDSKALSEVRTDAELRDEDGQAVSKGEARLSPADKVVLFYPHDRAPQDMIRSRAKILFRSDLNESLVISEVEDCREEIPHLLHFHIVLA